MLEIQYRDTITGKSTGHAVPFRDAHPGEEIIITIRDARPVPAPDCRGEGQYHEHECPTCHAEFACTHRHAVASLSTADLARLHHPRRTLRAEHATRTHDDRYRRVPWPRE